MNCEEPCPQTYALKNAQRFKFGFLSLSILRISEKKYIFLVWIWDAVRVSFFIFFLIFKIDTQIHAQKI